MIVIRVCFCSASTCASRRGPCGSCSLILAQALASRESSPAPSPSSASASRRNPAVSRRSSSWEDRFASSCRRSIRTDWSTWAKRTSAFRRVSAIISLRRGALSSRPRALTIASAGEVSAGDVGAGCGESRLCREDPWMLGDPPASECEGHESRQCLYSACRSCPCCARDRKRLGKRTHSLGGPPWASPCGSSREASSCARLRQASGQRLRRALSKLLKAKSAPACALGDVAWCLSPRGNHVRRRLPSQWLATSARDRCRAPTLRPPSALPPAGKV
mmetsp:Transcript_43594/g.117586  ORF Transcript_43594/g.117586 Transcript_43594/m.117586 type:complete len:276 (+) Transcript_43594:420-1247(+)